MRSVPFMRLVRVRRSILLTIAAVAGGAWLWSRARASGFSFQGKVVLITGGSRGLGLVLARRIFREGGHLALLARKGDELARAKAELGSDVLTLECDLRDPTQIQNAVRATADHFGGIDVVINNAGIIEVGPCEHMTIEDYERAMAVHFWAPYHVMMAALPHLRRQPEARIVNITSIGGKIAVPHLAPYCASKFAAVGLSDALRSELARERIFVTTVAPGMMRTGSHVNAQFKGDHGAEFSWFAASAGLPLLSISAEHAAASILRACQRGQPFLGLGISTKFAIAANGVAPNIVARALTLVGRLLPKPAGSAGNQLRSGWQSRAHSNVPRWATHFADRNIVPNNESDGAAT